MLLVLNIHSLQQGQFVIKRLLRSDEASLFIVFKLLLMHGNTRYLIHVHFIQPLRQLQQRLHETWNLTPKALVNACRPRVLRTPINCSYGMRTLDKLPRYRIRYCILAGSSNCFITIYCIHFLPGDRPLRLQFYEWLRYKQAADNYP